MNHANTRFTGLCVSVKEEKKEKTTIEMRTDFEKQQKHSHTFFPFTASVAAMLSEPPGANAAADTHSVYVATERRIPCLSSAVHSCVFFRPCERTIKVGGGHASALGHAESEKPNR